jgi:hypothetical protein
MRQLEHLAAPKLLLERQLLGSIDAVNLKDVLG